MKFRNDNPIGRPVKADEMFSSALSAFAGRLWKTTADLQAIEYWNQTINAIFAEKRVPRAKAFDSHLPIEADK